MKRLLLVLCFFNYLLVYSQTVTDVEGNEYKTVDIGSQTWMAENLRVTKYPDGTPIKEIKSNAAWAALQNTNLGADAAYCWYDYDSIQYAQTYGALYTWQAVMGAKEGVDALSSDAKPSGVQGICPDGWHVPSRAEWEQLEEYISSDGYSGREAVAIKATSGWNENGNGNDVYGFSALPSGQINSVSGRIDNLGYNGRWFSSTETSETKVSSVWMRMDTRTIGYSDISYKSEGKCVRCVKDITTSASIFEKKESVFLYPNPAAGRLYIIPGFDGEVLIFNSSGVEVLRSNKPKTIDISTLKNGIYLAKLIQEKASITQKLVIK